MRARLLAYWQPVEAKVRAFRPGRAIALCAYGTLGGAVAVISIALVLYDILQWANSNHPGRFWPSRDKAAAADEVRHYSEFVTVKHSALNLKITTGIRYDSSTVRNVEAQWCYAQLGKGARSGFALHLNIQEIKGGKTQTFAPYPMQTLREFGLTPAQASGLKSYCRFK